MPPPFRSNIRGEIVAIECRKARGGVKVSFHHIIVALHREIRFVDLWRAGGLNIAYSIKEHRMEKRRIGSLQVSVVGLGCNNFGSRLDPAATARVLDAAIAAGVNFFDTADIYGKTQSEQFMGQALGARRSAVLIATKFGCAVNDQKKGARPEYVRQACEDSLKRLGIAHIDLYQLHRPDPETPIADTLNALDGLVKAGKVREIGCSNFSAEQLREAEAAVRQGAARFVTVQNEYSLFQREPEAAVLPECEHLRLAFLPYFPLANGLLSGKYRKGQPVPEGRIKSGKSSALNEKNLAGIEALIGFSSVRGHSLLELAFSWLLSRAPVASVIAGATSAEQIQANALAANWKLTPADLAEVDRILAA
jgi:aryl-alcohol dehydrogenase-like predicted oxidoreductase